MHDTTPEADRVRLEAIRRMAPVDRLAQALEWSESVRELALIRLRQLHPGRSDLELVELMLGERLMPPPQARPGV
jgi:hypothetical protein